MTVVCVRCESVINRYAPVEDREYALCAACASQLGRAPDDDLPLHCGRDGCLLDVVPYACLVAEAHNAPIEACPAVA